MEVRMRHLFAVITGAALLLLGVSCSSGGSESCPAGYHWDDATHQCEPDTSEPDNEQDIDTATDDSLPDDAVDELADTLVPDDDVYTGPCILAREGDAVAFDVKLHAVTIGTITVGGVDDDAHVAGELWGKNEATGSDFKIATLVPSLSGTVIEFPAGTYKLFYRGPKSAPTDPDNTMVDMDKKLTVTAAATLNIDLPLYVLQGSVTKNGAAFPALAAGEDTATSITFTSGSYSFTVPYAEFGAFTRVMPAGTYTVSFTGHLAGGAPLFTGRVYLGDTALKLTEALSEPIDIVTTTVAGPVVMDGATVDSGVLAIVRNPPFESISLALISDLGADQNYSAEVIANEGITYVVTYLSDIADYPYSFQKIAEWKDLAADSGSVALDMGRIHGTISLRTAGGPFPALTSCTVDEPLCTRGKLKVMSIAAGTTTIKDLGISGDDYAYEALVLRRQRVCADIDCTTYDYAPLSFSLIFDGYFNDVAGMTNYLPFSVRLNNNGTENFQFTDGSGGFTTDMTLDLVVVPTQVSGTVTYNGAALPETDDDLLFLRDVDTQTETPVARLKDLTGGAYSFFAPAASYHVVYKGASLLGYEQKGVVNTDLTVGDTDITAKIVDIGTAKMGLDLTVNGLSLAELLTAYPAIDRYDFSAANDKNTLGSSVITATQVESHPFFLVLRSPSWDLYLNLHVKEGSDDSIFRFPIAQLVDVSADTVVQGDLKAVAFTGNLTANGAAVTGAASSRGFIELSGTGSRAKAFFPPIGTQATRFFLAPQTYNTPTPQITVDDGFDVSLKIDAPCILVEE